MKLRLRFRKTTKVLAIDDEQKDSFNVKDLRSAALQLFSSDVLRDFSLSLNNADILKDETQLLSVYDIVSGDLVYIVSDSEPSVQQPQPQKPVLLNSSPSLDQVCGAGSMEKMEDSQQTVGHSSDHPSSSRVPSGGEAPQGITMDTGQPGATCSTAQEFSGADGGDLDGEPVNEAIVNQCLSEPVLCREASYGCVPSLLREHYDSAEPRDVQEAISVVLHVLMVETGFIHVQSSQVRRLPDVWRQEGFFKLTYQYLACEDTTCSLTVLATGPLIVVHGRVHGSPSASRQCQLRTRDFIQAVTQDCLECYIQLPKLSRVFKDSIANPLVHDMRTAAGLEDVFGILALTQEVKLKILSFLDVRSLCKMTQVNTEMSGLCKDPYLWRRLYLRCFGNRRDNSLSQNWRQMYIQEMKARKERRRQFSRMMTHPYSGLVNPFGGPSHFLPPPPGGIIGGDYDLYPNFQGNLPGIPGRFGPTPLDLPRPRYDLIGPDPYADPNVPSGILPRRPRGGGAARGGRLNPFPDFGPRFF